ncbi:MAG: AAA family ATPase [Alphaproteobacteria bacterium]
MRLTAVSIQGYRSVRRIRFPVGPLTVFVGRNGVGKTNLYRGLALLHAAANGSITRELAEEGGMASVLWAGKRRKGDPARLVLAAEFDALEYAIEVGFPAPMFPALDGEPLVKAERLAARVDGGRPVTLMERKGPAVWLRDATGRRRTFEDALLASETALAAFRETALLPELGAVRHAMQDWRLYHEFRTDTAAPVRRPCLAIATPSLAADGHDLAAVLATLVEIGGDAAAFMSAVDDAFPGVRLGVEGEGGNHRRLTMLFPEMQRPPPEPSRIFGAHELSDGTLKYLCLVGALCGYRMPGFVALNEPESSLHPDLIAPLARLIASRSEVARLWVVTHSETLGDALADLTGNPPLVVTKREGETWIEGLSLLGSFADEQ